MAPTPTGIQIGGVQYPASDLSHANGQQYLTYNGQTYMIGGGGQLTPTTAPSNAIQTFPNTGSPTDETSTDYSHLLPSASSYESFAPLPYQSFGSVPYTQAATVNPASVAGTPAMQAAQQQSVAGPSAATVDLSQMPGALQQYEQSVKQALAPTFQQQQDAVTADLAKRGIYNSTAGAQLQTNLQGQQDAALASAYEPLISQFAGAYTSGQQQNSAQQQSANLTGYQGLLSQAQTNAANQQSANSTNYSGSQAFNQLVAQLQQQAALENQAAMNTANTQNANTYNNVVGGNATAYNNYLDALRQDQTGLSTGLTKDILQTYDPQLYNSLLTQGTANAGNAYSNAYNAGAGNTANLSSTLGNLATQLTTKPAGGSTSPVNTSSWPVNATA